MLNETDMVTKWNKPICWFFAILLSPVGFLIWIVNIIRDGGRFSDANKWAILTPGFYVGLFLSLIVVGPFASSYHKYQIKRWEKKYNQSEKGKKHQEIIQKIVELFEEIGESITEEKGYSTEVVVVNEIYDKEFRVHLLYNQNKGNHIFFLDKERQRCSCEGKCFPVDQIDFEEIRKRIMNEIKKEAI